MCKMLWRCDSLHGLPAERHGIVLDMQQKRGASMQASAFPHPLHFLGSRYGIDSAGT